VQYALLIYGSGDGWEKLSEEEQQKQMQEYMALSQRPETRGGADLGELSSSTTVRVNDGETLTTSKIPAARNGGAIEVRPVVEH